MSLCAGKTAKNKPCTKRVTNGKYCHNHKSQEVNKIKEEKKEEKVSYNEPYIAPTDITCPICLDDMEEDICMLKCEHHFHTACIKRVLKAECPVCRIPLNMKDTKILKNIKLQEEIEKKNNIKEQIKQDIIYAQELQNIKEEPKRYTEEEQIMMAIKESIEEYNKYIEEECEILMKYEQEHQKEKNVHFIGRTDDIINFLSKI